MMHPNRYDRTNNSANKNIRKMKSSNSIITSFFHAMTEEERDDGHWAASTKKMNKLEYN